MSAANSIKQCSHRQGFRATNGGTSERISNLGRPKRKHECTFDQKHTHNEISKAFPPTSEEAETGPRPSKRAKMNEFDGTPAARHGIIRNLLAEARQYISETVTGPYHTTSYAAELDNGTAKDVRLITQYPANPIESLSRAGDQSEEPSKPKSRKERDLEERERKSAAQKKSRDEAAARLLQAKANRKIVSQAAARTNRLSQSLQLGPSRSESSRTGAARPSSSVQPSGSSPPTSRPVSSTQTVSPTGRSCQRCTAYEASIYRKFCFQCGHAFPPSTAPRSYATGVVQIDRTPDTLRTQADPRNRQIVTYPRPRGPDDSIHGSDMLTGGAGPAGTLDSDGNHEPISPSILRQLLHEQNERLLAQSEAQAWANTARENAQANGLPIPVAQPYYDELTPEEIVRTKKEVEEMHKERNEPNAVAKWAERQEERKREARLRQQEREAKAAEEEKREARRIKKQEQEFERRCQAIRHALRPERSEAERQQWLQVLLDTAQAAQRAGGYFSRNNVPGYWDLSDEDKAVFQQDARIVRDMNAASKAATSKSSNVGAGKSVKSKGQGKDVGVGGNGAQSGKPDGDDSDDSFDDSSDENDEREKKQKAEQDDEQNDLQDEQDENPSFLADVAHSMHLLAARGQEFPVDLHNWSTYTADMRQQVLDAGLEVERQWELEREIWRSNRMY
ncbi:hypothetical protein NX059_011208 [Plenodomus lindquistii]|nr:hypothetical protein NX059_011208 [Plenodomus lindquistii]